MKKMKFVLATMLVLFTCTATTLFAQSKEEKKKEVATKVQTLIESGDFEIQVNRAVPSGGQSKELTSPYEIEVENGNASSYLPYFGVAYSAPIGEDGGIKFEDLPMIDYKVKKDKKDKYVVTYKVNDGRNSYNFRIEVFDNGNSTISVTPSTKRAITFYGNLKLESDDND